MPWHVSRLPSFIDNHDPVAARKSVDAFRRTQPKLAAKMEAELLAVERWIAAAQDGIPPASVTRPAHSASLKLTDKAPDYDTD